MKNGFNLGIEISEKVIKTSTPRKIKRYGETFKPVVKQNVSSENKVYRYRPGVNSFIMRDFDV